MKGKMRSEIERMLIPEKEFFYTIEQIAALLGTSQKNVRSNYLFYEGRTDQKLYSPRRMRAININPNEDGASQWRIAEKEYVRWLKYHKVL